MRNLQVYVFLFSQLFPFQEFLDIFLNLCPSEPKVLAVTDSLVQQQAKGHASGAVEVSISVLTFGKWYNLSKNPNTLKLSVNKDGFFT